jgi:hypothetical protein
MDLMIVAAFAAFFAMVVAWMAAPTQGKQLTAPAIEPGTLSVGEARA